MSAAAEARALAHRFGMLREDAIENLILNGGI
jgi:hypothetical protein